MAIYSLTSQIDGVFREYPLQMLRSIESAYNQIFVDHSMG